MEKEVNMKPSLLTALSSKRRLLCELSIRNSPNFVLVFECNLTFFQCGCSKLEKLTFFFFANKFFLCVCAVMQQRQ